jgi:hypothetical protein
MIGEVRGPGLPYPEPWVERPRVWLIAIAAIAAWGTVALLLWGTGVL